MANSFALAPAPNATPCLDEDHALADRLRGLPPGLASRQATAAWSDRMPARTGRSTARWLSARSARERRAVLP